MTRICKQCGRSFEPKRPHQIYDTEECRYQGWIEKEVLAAQAGDQRVEKQPLRSVRGQQEEGGDSADYLILAREQIARTLLHTGWFTADDLEPLGIPQQYRRSVHGSATGYFSGEQPYMEEAGRRKSERPERKGGKNTVFRITARGRRELPGLLKDMAGPVTEANKRLYGQPLVGVGGGFVADARSASAAAAHSPHSGETAQTSHREGTAGPLIAGTLDRPGVEHDRVDSNGARSSNVTANSPAGGSDCNLTRERASGCQLEDVPAGEAVPLFEDEARPLSAFTDAEAA